MSNKIKELKDIIKTLVKDREYAYGRIASKLNEVSTMQKNANLTIESNTNIAGEELNNLISKMDQYNRNIFRLTNLKKQLDDQLLIDRNNKISDLIKERESMHNNKIKEINDIIQNNTSHYNQCQENIVVNTKQIKYLTKQINALNRELNPDLRERTELEDRLGELYTLINNDTLESAEKLDYIKQLKVKLSALT